MLANKRHEFRGQGLPSRPDIAAVWEDPASKIQFALMASLLAYLYGLNLCAAGFSVVHDSNSRTAFLSRPLRLTFSGAARGAGRFEPRASLVRFLAPPGRIAVPHGGRAWRGALSLSRLHCAHVGRPRVIFLGWRFLLALPPLAVSIDHDPSACFGLQPDHSRCRSSPHSRR